jgi:glycosyltransferase involved in cell wall biosynthesis
MVNHTLPGCKRLFKILMNPKIYVSVTSDLATDQRVRRVCEVLIDTGYKVVLIGRKLPESLPINRPYKTIRFVLPFKRGAGFYIIYQIRLFFFLLFAPKGFLLANDLDTLLPNYLISRIKRVPLVYDTHEYFCGVPELQNRPFIRKIWKSVESWIFPNLKYVFTVNNSIAKLYEDDYGVRPMVFRNIGSRIVSKKFKTRQELGLPLEKVICINQGTGINVDRGMEEFLEALALMPEVVLLLVGSGDAIPGLKTKVAGLSLEKQVIFVDKVPYEDLLHYTANADIGLSLDKPTNINYRYSLPNKIFDYIQCGIPVLASDLPEVANIVKGYEVGCCVFGHSPPELAEGVTSVLNMKGPALKGKIEKAASQLHWEAEGKALVEFYSNFKRVV